MGTTDAEERQARATGDKLWPVIIIVALAVVMAVNAAFIYIAVSGADEVAPSYLSGQR